MTEVALLGDMHANWSALHIQVKRMINEVPNLEAIFQVGDFGLFPGRDTESKRLHRVDRALAEAGVPMFVTPGNHEDWNWIDSWSHQDRMTLLPGGFTNIFILPRVLKFTVGEKTVLSVSGANSIDFKYRVPNRTWWLQEQISDEMVEQASLYGKVDVLLCHDAPYNPTTPAVEYILKNNPGGWSYSERTYAEASSHQLSKIANAVAPSLIVHGHMHVRDSWTDERRGVRIESLDIEGSVDAWIKETF